MKKRLLSILTALALCLSLSPVPAFAAGPEDADPSPHQTRQDGDYDLSGDAENPRGGINPLQAVEDVCAHPGIDADGKCTGCGELVVGTIHFKSREGEAVENYVSMDELWWAIREWHPETMDDTMDADVMLLQSGTVSSTISIQRGANVTLSMAGNVKLSGSSDTRVLFDVYDGTFTLESGTLEATARVCIQTFDFGTVKILDGSISGGSSGIYVSNNATATISGGSISGGSFGIELLENATATISGGSISGGSFGIELLDNATATISGDSISISGGNQGISVSGNATATISGGTITGTRDVSLKAFTAKGSVTLSGGTFENGIGTTKLSCVGNLLAPGYGYKTGDDTWITGDAWDGTAITGPVTVERAPVELSGPESLDPVDYGSTDGLTLSVQVVQPDAEAAAYQWYVVATKEDEYIEYFELTKINGATSETYPVPADLTGGDYSYFCAVTIDGCTVKSQPATVTVLCPHTQVSDNGYEVPHCNLCDRDLSVWVEPWGGDGGSKTYYLDISEAWNAACKMTETPQVTIFEYAECEETVLEVPSGKTIWLKGTGRIMDSPDGPVELPAHLMGQIHVQAGGTLGLSHCYIMPVKRPGGGSMDTVTVEGDLLIEPPAEGEEPHVRIGNFGSGFGLVVGAGSPTKLKDCEIYGLLAEGRCIGDLLAGGYGYYAETYYWLPGTELERTDFEGQLMVLPVPVSITSQPASPEVTYGYENGPTLSVTAEARDPAQAITYQWFKVAETGEGMEVVEGYDEAVENGTSADLQVPTGLPAGEHQFYCVVTCDGYDLRSAPATVTVNPRVLEPRFSGPTTKTYDGADNPPNGLIIELDGLLEGDDVVCMIEKIVYNSANVKEATEITATGIALVEGADKDNYVLSATTVSIPASITKDTSGEPPAAGEGYTIDYFNETIAVTDGYEVYTTGLRGQLVPSGSVSAYLGQTLRVRKVADDNHDASGFTEFPVAARPEMPDLTVRSETLKGKRDGGLTGLTDQMEFRMDGSLWLGAEEGNADLSGLAGNMVVEVRIRATENTPASAVKRYTIGEGKGITVRFDHGAQEAVMPADQTGMSFGASVAEPPKPTAENQDYVFDGWYRDSACQTKWDFEADTVTEETVTLYAGWKQVRFKLHVTVLDSAGNELIDGAAVALKQGSARIDSGITGPDGKFVFPNSVPTGAYNVVTVYEGLTKTSLVTITDKDVELEVKLPPEGANSRLTIETPDTPAVVVGGLDDEAAELIKDPDVTEVTVTMSVEAKPEAKAEGAAEIKEVAKDVSAALEFLDVSLTASVTKSGKTETENLTQTTTLMELVVPFSFKGKVNVTVYRYHDGGAAALTAAANGSSREENQYWADLASGLIHIYTKQFSTYAIGYNAAFDITFDAGNGTPPTIVPTSSDGKVTSIPEKPTREGYTFNGWYTERGEKVTADTVFQGDATVSARWTRNSTNSETSPSTGGSSGATGSGSSGSSSSSSGGGDSTYDVSMEKPEHGSVTTVRNSADSGNTVTLTVTPDSGYMLDTLTVTDSRGNALKLTAKGSNQYTFTMPNRAVSVTATFVPVPEDVEGACDGGAGCASHGLTDLGGVDAWYHEAVDYVLAQGLMSGYGDGRFGPGDTLSRAQLAQILYNKEGRPAVSAENPFADVAAGAWYAGAVVWANARGIVGGYGNGKAGPDDPISREQLAVMLWRYAGSPAAAGKELNFADAGEAGDYALEALRWAVENGILTGTGGGRLNPAGLATRAEVAQMLMRYMNAE